MPRVHKTTTIVFLIASLFLPHLAKADDAEPAGDRAPAGVKRTVQQYDQGPTVPDAYSNELDAPKKAKEKSMMGVQVNTYWDGLTTYDKLNPYGGLGAFTDQTSSGGIFGMQVLLAFVMAHWEFTTGFDYMFPVSAQGQGVVSGNYYVNSQTLNIMGLKALQIGYRFNAGSITIVPYGGIGFYYGKDVVNLTTNALTAPGTDTVTYSKLLCNFIAGARAEYLFPGSPKFAIGAAAEFFMPTKIADSLSQSGGATTELPGFESNLQNNMDFMTNIGGRILLNAGLYF